MIRRQFLKKSTTFLFLPFIGIERFLNRNTPVILECATFPPKKMDLKNFDRAKAKWENGQDVEQVMNTYTNTGDILHKELNPTETQFVWMIKFRSLNSYVKVFNSFSRKNTHNDRKRRDDGFYISFKLTRGNEILINKNEMTGQLSVSPIISRRMIKKINLFG